MSTNNQSSVLVNSSVIISGVTGPTGPGGLGGSNGPVGSIGFIGPTGATVTGTYNAASSTGIGGVYGLTSTGDQTNTLYGYNSGVNISTLTGSNTALGYESLYNMTSGPRSTCIGYRSGNANSTTETLAIGYKAGYGANDIPSCTSIGAFAVNQNVSNISVTVGGFANFGQTGSNPPAITTAVGYLALTQQTDPATSNVAMGYYTAARISTGAQNTFIGRLNGYDVNFSIGKNCTVIGNYNDPSSSGAQNEITLGNGSISALRCQATTITSLSDIRDKKDIQDLPIGLNFVEKLRPVEFLWNTRDGTKVDIKDTGFIAQEVQSLENELGYKIPHLIYDENPEKLELSQGIIIQLLVKAIKELSEKAARLEKRLSEKMLIKG